MTAQSAVALRSFLKHLLRTQIHSQLLWRSQLSIRRNLRKYPTFCFYLYRIHLSSSLLCLTNCCEDQCISKYMRGNGLQMTAKKSSWTREPCWKLLERTSLFYFYTTQLICQLQSWCSKSWTVWWTEKHGLYSRICLRLSLERPPKCQSKIRS